MNNDVKEMLDIIRKLVEQSPNRGSYGITHKKWKQVLDYITNLQERFDALLEAHKISDELETEYQERNEKAIEYIKEQGCLDLDIRCTCGLNPDETLHLFSILEGDDKE